MRVWDNNYGTLTNWQQVRTNGWIARGESLPFISRPLGGSLVLPPNLEGLESFNLALPMGVAALLPSAPTNLQATTVSDTQIDVSWQDTSTNELGFRIERSLDGIAFAFGGTTSSNVAVFSSLGLRPGTRHYYRVRAFNSTGESRFSNTNSASTRTPFAQWQFTHFTPDQLADPTLAGADADPDADGLPYFVEHTFNRAPLWADLDRPGALAIDRLPNQLDFLTVVFTRNKAAIDAVVDAEASSNLSTWQSGPNFVTGPVRVNE